MAVGSLTPHAPPPPARQSSANAGVFALSSMPGLNFPTLQPSQLPGLQPPSGLFLGGAQHLRPPGSGASGVVSVGRVASAASSSAPAVEASEYLAKKDKEIEELNRRLAMLQQQVHEERALHQKEVPGSPSRLAMPLEQAPVPTSVSAATVAAQVESFRSEAPVLTAELMGFRRDVAQAADVSKQLNQWFLENSSRLRVQENWTSPSAFLERNTAALRRHVEAIVKHWEEAQGLVSEARSHNNSDVVDVFAASDASSVPIVVNKVVNIDEIVAPALAAIVVDSYSASTAVAPAVAAASHVEEASLGSQLNAGRLGSAAHRTASSLSPAASRSEGSGDEDCVGQTLPGKSPPAMLRPSYQSFSIGHGKTTSV